MSPLELLALTMATFYTAYAVSSTHGPFGLFASMRERVPLGGLTRCIICLSPWCSALFYWLLTTPLASIVWILAAAGGTVFIWRYTGGGAV